MLPHVGIAAVCRPDAKVHDSRISEDYGFFLHAAWGILENAHLPLLWDLLCNFPPNRVLVELLLVVPQMEIALSGGGQAMSEN